jgi:isoamylase
MLYGFRVEGPSAPALGHRFNSDAVVLDPYARGVVSRPRFSEPAAGDNCWPQLAATLPDAAAPLFDWEGTTSPNRPLDDLVIYECHVRGFTKHPSSGATRTRACSCATGPHARPRAHTRRADAPPRTDSRAPANAGVPAASSGTYAAMIEKLPHLVRMGFNALELLPVHEFNEVEYYAPPRAEAPEGGARCNFWGYSTLGFFAPMARYAAAPPGEAAAAELKSLVRACHAAGVEVILDVVFNHTAEGNEQGPTVSLRGLDNSVYYMTAPEGQFYNYSGCGNTLNCNHPVVRRFILDCLRHWAIEYRIDGFRFDLASILTRAPNTWETGVIYGAGPEEVAAAGAVAAAGDVVRGTPLAEPPLIDLISNDGVLRVRGSAAAPPRGLLLRHTVRGAPSHLRRPLLARDSCCARSHTASLSRRRSAAASFQGKKLIAEAWDAGGLYQVGSFPHWGVWAEWNGKFRDAVRQFIKGTDGYAGEFAERLCGSPALYAPGGRAPRHSINFVTAHDGFSLADLVSYNRKNNVANGEENRDGEEHNLSWNCGVSDSDEGDAAGPVVRALRRRQMRNMVAALFLAQGVPMMCMGDEYGHTKGGNNNTYCHDSALNWFDWGTSAADKDGLQRFVAALSAFRASRPSLRLRAHPTGDQVAWHGRQPEKPDWSEASRLVAFTLVDGPACTPLYVAFNTSHLPVTLTLPTPGPGRRWRLVMDTALPPPYDMPAEDVPASLRSAAAAQHASLGACIYTLLDRATLVLSGDLIAA